MKINDTIIDKAHNDDEIKKEIFNTIVKRKISEKMLIKIIFELHPNPQNCIKLIPNKFMVKYTNILQECVNREEKEMCEYLLIYFDNFYADVRTLDNLEIIKLFATKALPLFKKTYLNLFQRACFKNKHDIFDYIIENFGDEEEIFKRILSIMSLSLHSDIFKKIIEKYYKSLDSFPNWDIKIFDINTISIFRVYGLAKKINPLTIFREVEYLKDARFEIDIKGFIESGKLDPFQTILLSVSCPEFEYTFNDFLKHLSYNNLISLERNYYSDLINVVSKKYCEMEVNYIKTLINFQ